VLNDTITVCFRAFEVPKFEVVIKELGLKLRRGKKRREFVLIVPILITKPDNRYLVTCPNIKLLHVWDVVKDQAVHRFGGELRKHLEKLVKKHDNAGVQS
jgi:hypothetical protein